MNEELSQEQLAEADALYEKYQDVTPDIHASVYVNPMVTTSLRLSAETHKGGGRHRGTFAGHLQQPVAVYLAFDARG